jgi:hypothetical protein
MSDIVKRQIGDYLDRQDYKEMLNHIDNNLPAALKTSQNFYKSSSQFKNVTIDITNLTPMSSIKHILAIVEQARVALEGAVFDQQRNRINLEAKTKDYDKLEDSTEKRLLEIDILELQSKISNSENYIKGTIRRISFCMTQYQSVLDKLGMTSISEEDYEREENRYHIMTAFKQALCVARSNGGVIDEGNQIYIFELGINGAVAQAELTAYLEYEQRMLNNNQEPQHDMTIRWLEACADKFADNAAIFAKARGLVTLDNTSLLKEIE